MSSARGTARQAACQRTATGPPRPPIFAGTIRLRRGILRLHTCRTSFTRLIKAKNPYTYAIVVTFNVVDSGFMVDLGVYRAPNQPNSPDQPRYFTPRHTTGRLCITANRSNCRGAGCRLVAGFNVEDSGYTEDLGP